MCLQVRQQGEADVKAELRHPVIRPVASPPARRLAGLHSARGGTQGTGGDGGMAATHKQPERKQTQQLLLGGMEVDRDKQKY